jgi:hypothetical protein
MGYKDDNYSTKVCGHHPETCTCRDWDTKEKPKQELNLNCFDCNKSLQDCTCMEDTIDMKQETLEEAAERLYPTTIDSFTDTGIDISATERIIFIEGAKWQQERMYSEALQFAEWCNDMGYIQVANSFWKSLSDEKGKTTKELFKHFKKK